MFSEKQYGLPTAHTHYPYSPTPHHLSRVYGEQGP